MSEVLCFFGMGALFESCYAQLVMAAGRSPDLLCDNDPAKWGKTYFGVSCVSPDQLRTHSNAVRVVVCVRDDEAVRSQLLALGIDDLLVARFGRGYDHVFRLQPLSLPPDAKGGMLSIRGKWAMVTGASRGIGRQIALGLARLGANLIVHARAEPHGLAVETECKALGVDTCRWYADLGDRSTLEMLAGRIARDLPPMDILYNNAGTAPPCRDGFWRTSPRDYLDTYVVNTVAPIELVRATAPGMMSRGFGRIVNVSSSIRGAADAIAYACSKAALDKFSFDLAPSLVGTGVTISQLDPGWLRTDMGGPTAPHGVDSVLPGALLGAVVDGQINGGWIVAQDYAGMTLEAAVARAFFTGAVAA